MQPSLAQIFVGRQPIFDRALKVYGYELLFRSGESNTAGVTDGNIASAQTIYNSLFEMGLDNLVGEKKAFINFTGDLLQMTVPQLLPSDQIVLEILEDVALDQKLVKVIAKLAKYGFEVALDDFVYEPKWEPVLEHASIIKIDVLVNSAKEVQEMVQKVKKRGQKLLAEKVEMHKEFETYRDMGFDYFQGYFFEKPKVVTFESLPDNHVALLHLVAELQNPGIGLEEVEKLISQTVSLNYKIFRYINSAHFSLPRKFDSVREVLVYIGLQKLKDMATLISMSGVPNKPSELIVTGLMRAKMCELLANDKGIRDTHSYFIVGLFSILDALLDHPLPQILSELPLTEDVVNAILEKQGPMGEALQCCIACERGQPAMATIPQIDENRIIELHHKAIEWATQASSAIT